MKERWKERLPKIDEMLQAGMSLEEIAPQFGVMASTLERRLYSLGYNNLHKKRMEICEFWCRQCGQHVTADPMKGDHRKVFCSPKCEKKYWKKPERYGTGAHWIRVKK